jgi:hypothetical protein
VIIDLTTGTGRFNLVRGFVGTVMAIAALSAPASLALFSEVWEIGRAF